jgi:hypothetical protein
MRFVLALGLLMTLCVSANAATTHHRSKRPEGHFRPTILPSGVDSLGEQNDRRRGESPPVHDGGFFLHSPDRPT